MNQCCCHQKDSAVWDCQCLSEHSTKHTRRRIPLQFQERSNVNKKFSVSIKKNRNKNKQKKVTFFLLFFKVCEIIAWVIFFAQDFFPVHLLKFCHLHRCHCECHFNVFFCLNILREQVKRVERDFLTRLTVTNRTNKQQK